MGSISPAKARRSTSTVTVQFDDIGRTRRSWVTEMSSISERAMRDQLVSHCRSLVGRDIWITWNQEGTVADVVVAGERQSGKIRLIGGFKLP